MQNIPSYDYSQFVQVPISDFLFENDFKHLDEDFNHYITGVISHFKKMVPGERIILGWRGQCIKQCEVFLLTNFARVLTVSFKYENGKAVNHGACCDEVLFWLPSDKIEFIRLMMEARTPASDILNYIRALKNKSEFVLSRETMKKLYVDLNKIRAENSFLKKEKGELEKKNTLLEERNNILIKENSAFQTEIIRKDYIIQELNKTLRTIPEIKEFEKKTDEMTKVILSDRTASDKMKEQQEAFMMSMATMAKELNDMKAKLNASQDYCLQLQNILLGKK